MLLISAGSCFILVLENAIIHLFFFLKNANVFLSRYDTLAWFNTSKRYIFPPTLAFQASSSHSSILSLQISFFPSTLHSETLNFIYTDLFLIYCLFILHFLSSYLCAIF